MTNDADERANPDLADMRGKLVALAARLDEAVDAAPDAAAVRALTAQIAEVNARVTAVGRQLMARRTDAIRNGAQDVASALPRLGRALRNLDRIENLVAGVASVLALVDTAVETARLEG